MRVAIFGDIHADVEALRALCADIDDAEIDRVWCLGDFAFGGRSADACFDLTMQKTEVVLAGNHEWVLSRKAHDPFMLSHPRQFPEYAALGHERLDRLLGLKPYCVLSELGVELVHGSLTEPKFDFVRDERSAERRMAMATQSIVVCGHTHNAAYYRETPSGSMEHVCKRVGVPYVLDRRCILNPGAGRDGPSHSRWLELTLDREERTARDSHAQSRLIPPVNAPVEIDARPGPEKSSRVWLFGVFEFASLTPTAVPPLVRGMLALGSLARRRLGPSRR